jgi:hypothetical protein
VGVPGAVPEGRVPMERLAVSLLVSDGRGQFAGEPDAWGGIPLVTVRLLGRQVPVLRAASGPFDATGLWSALQAALRAEAEGGDRPPPAAYARTDAAPAAIGGMNSGATESVQEHEMLR